MREKFSTPDKISKGNEHKEIEQGLSEFLGSPRSKEGMHPRLIESFEIVESEKPFQRQDIEKEVENYIDKNFEAFLSFFINNNFSISEVIEKLGITNEQIGLLGANYYLRSIDGRQKIFITDEYYPEGYEESDSNINVSDIIALAYAKDQIRVDSLRESGQTSQLSHRYYLRSQDRYLCANDFGIRVWDEEEKKMVSGDPTNASSFIQAIRSQVERISENIQTVLQGLIQKKRIESEEPLHKRSEYGWQDDNNSDDSVLKNAKEEIFTRLTTNPKDKELVLTAVQGSKVKNHLHFHFDKIARKYGFFSDDPVADYQNFGRNSSKLKKLIQIPSERDKGGATLDYAYFDFYQKPVIIGGDSFLESLTAEASAGVQEALVNRALNNESDDVRDCFQQHHCSRGPHSPYFYKDQQLYDLIKTIGVEQTQQVLDKDDRNISEQMTGLKYLQAMGYDLARMETDELRKQIYEAHKMDRSGLWKYLEERQNTEPNQKRSNLYKSDDDRQWLELVGKKKAKDFYNEGKRMYWLAHRVWKANPSTTIDDRFYNSDRNVDWSRYDLTNYDVSGEKLNEYLKKNGDFIIALLGQGQEARNYYSERPQPGTQVTLGLIVQVLERGQELRGVALAKDKKRYLEGLIKGNVTNDLEFAIADWSAEWRQAVSKEEMELYYEYAGDYVLLEPDGLTKYASWRASEEGQRWNELFKEAPERKSDLDFRICLGNQTEEVRGWYKDGAEYVGGTVMQNYLLRFNALKDSTGRFVNLHDVLFWVPNIQKLESSDAKSVIANIDTMDDNQEFVNLLPRYHKESDKLTNQGPIQSLRELKKRILAIESNIDLTGLPPQIIDIISAPGFNLSALESMRKRDDFKDLVEGKLDKNQPFQPHRRIFAGRPLTDALREGLGSQKQNIRGTALDPKGLFHALGQLVKDRKLGDRNFKVTDLFESIPIDLEEEIIKLLQEQRVNIGPTVEAQIHAKSDPEGWVCGNYTDCCMPFGDSKNDDYMFNPSTQYFTIKYNGRIITQSVVVDGIDNMKGGDVVILDNIEVANNFKNLTPLLSNVYQTFWTEYTSKSVKVGTGYSDLIPPGGRLEKNNYKSKTPLGYSDAKGPQIYDLPKYRGVESMDKVISLSNLTERDAEMIAKMEAEAYPEGMAQGKAHIAEVLKKQRELEIPGAASSFVIRKGQEPAGYLLVLPEESEVNPDEKVAHIYDMVVLPKFRGSPLARKMMERVLDVASSYGVAIEAEARASTSYPLLMNERIRKWFESKGFYLSANEKLSGYLNGEDFYFVRFENRQNTEATL
jgi:GNAT superfamily N-acetyltransferase